MELTYLNVLRININDRMLYVDNPSPRLLEIINNQKIADEFYEIILQFHSTIIYDSSYIENVITKALDSINKWGGNIYRIEKDTFKYYIINHRKDLDYQVSKNAIPVTEKEYNEFVHIVSYENVVNEMINNMPSHNDEVSLEVNKFVKYFIYTNSTNILLLTDNVTYTTRQIADLICKCKDIKNALRERTRGGFNNLHLYYKNETKR